MSMLAVFMLAGEPCHWMKDLGFWVLDMVPKIENQMEEKMGNCAYVWALHEHSPYEGTLVRLLPIVV